MRNDGWRVNLMVGFGKPTLPLEWDCTFYTKSGGTTGEKIAVFGGARDEKYILYEMREGWAGSGGLWAFGFGLWEDWPVG